MKSELIGRKYKIYTLVLQKTGYRGIGKVVSVMDNNGVYAYCRVRIEGSHMPNMVVWVDLQDEVK